MAETVVVRRREGVTVSSLEDLVTRKYESLLKVAVLVCREPADAEDAVQVALERAWKHVHDLRDADRLEAWLHRIVVREAIRLEQRRRGMLSRWFGRPPETIVEPSMPHDPDFAMRTALNDLPVEQRAALVLHHYAGFSVEETAELLGVRVETLRSRLKAARRRLRIALGDSPIGS